MVLGEEAIFTTQSRDPLALSVKHKPYSLFTGICEIIRSTVLFVLLWMAGRINPPGAMLNMSRAFFGKYARKPSFSPVTLHPKTQQYGALQRRFALPEQLARRVASSDGRE